MQLSPAAAGRLFTGSTAACPEFHRSLTGMLGQTQNPRRCDSLAPARPRRPVCPGRPLSGQSLVRRTNPLPGYALHLESGDRDSDQDRLAIAFSQLGRLTRAQGHCHSQTASGQPALRPCPPAAPEGSVHQRLQCSTVFANMAGIGFVPPKPITVCPPINLPSGGAT